MVRSSSSFNAQWHFCSVFVIARTVAAFVSLRFVGDFVANSLPPALMLSVL